MSLVYQGTCLNPYRRWAALGGSGVALALLSGCVTQLQSVHLVAGAKTPQAGVPYNLTFTQFNITMERSITACPGVAGKDDVEIGTDFALTSTEARDPDHEYALDMSSLRSFFKTTEISVSYHPNGALATVNAKAKDESGAFITSVAGTVSKILVSGATAGAPLTTAMATTNTVEPKRPGCAKETSDALKNLPSLISALKSSTLELNDATADLGSITRIAESQGPHSRESWKADLNAAFKRFTERREALRKAQKDVDSAKEKLSIGSWKGLWPKGGEITPSNSAAIKSATGDDIKDKLIEVRNPADLKGNFEYWLEIVGQTTGWTDSTKTSADSPPTVEGIRYRKAMPGWLVITGCKVGQEKTPNSCTSTVKSNLQPISQLGPIFSLPLKNYPFMTQSISAEFNEAGQPIKLGYFSEATSGKIANALDGVADQWVKVAEARKPKSELDVVNDQVALLTAKNQLAAAQKAQANQLDPDQQATDAAKAKAALFEAQLAQLKAEQALLEAQRQGAR